MEPEWNPIHNGTELEWNWNGIQFIMDGTGMELEWNPICNGWNWKLTGMESNS